MNKKKSIRKCPICQEENGEILHTQKFVLPEGHPLSNGYDILCCDRCGFVYADTTVSQKDYDIFYAKLSKYEDKKTATGGGESPYDAARLQKTAECIAGFLPDKSVRILDIGCANGGLLGYLKKLGYNNLCGLDPSPACVENTKQLYGIEAYAGSIFTPPQDLGDFDVVILSHVLEHIQDLASALSNFKNLLGKNGVLYAEVPDAKKYLDFYVSPFHYFDTEHINHFSLKFLERLLIPAGFTLIGKGEKEFELHPGTFYPAIWVMAGFSNEKISLKSNLDNLDLELRNRTIEYTKHSQKDFDPQMIDELVLNQDKIIVWGVGSSTMRLLANSSLERANIIAFVDSNPKYWGQYLMEKPIISPEELKNRQFKNETETILLTSKIYGKEILAQIVNELNLKNKVVTA
ncbi:MAG: class I SAM-dependent methyltransferase [Microcystis wesenbergii Mw_QC_S_20081001_S30D]|jgi:SAM-dependent methyltransferase|uniref:Class I SAM-dependent methyltransferase n=1 Tax=Microcystis wesenbergii Mw_QC_S_20081001_S30D TaxID=2486245 RepID=A0A552JPF7_9CHRO|nr:class I SAM-dependent methyltransferase [Microcystis aeruginosa W11-03]NCR95947.1 class I SAM-dependent methyltransferase [Microcystis aeruginosa W11-06]TRU97459.1 MAG: class I SAM-dependent methyltransferase [Microcystis wesenbergii Mw_QC_S_20081001_S30]TRU97631.1 MAG: class I SAM-dependent methyltransferase [Microcystis wesenbergii Mw_QC_S_20081001_S30D]TRU97803.1 MAG: class I SAM-dependent methyltransferase [Microcystis wesenbergii Mw_QC_B_20070930_S4D]TRV13078.1 MAG: class I SAM-depende